MCLSAVQDGCQVIQTRPQTFTWGYLIFTSALAVSQDESWKHTSVWQDINLDGGRFRRRSRWNRAFRRCCDCCRDTPGEWGQRASVRGNIDQRALADRWHTAELTSPHASDRERSKVGRLKTYLTAGMWLIVIVCVSPCFTFLVCILTQFVLPFIFVSALVGSCEEERARLSVGQLVKH